MEHLIFYLIVGIVVVDFLFERTLDYLNSRHLSPALPDELKGIYDEEKYRKSQAYLKSNLRFSMLSSGFTFLLIIAMLLFKGFAFVDAWTQMISHNVYLQTLIFFGILGLASEFLTFPFQWYDTFVIEEKFGFNKTTPITFLTDKLKSWLLAIILGGAILLFLQWAFLKAGDLFWLFAIGGTGIFIIFMTMFYTSLILPMFNTLIPLEDGDLKKSIESFAAQAGFQLTNIYVMDGSKRSTKANAFFSGLGPKKKIILYDTLINDLENEEIVSVLAHEIGHYKKKHIYKGLIFSLLQISVMFFLLWWALNTPEIGMSLGTETSSFYMGLLAFALLYSPVSFLMGIWSNLSSRKHEYEADHFASSYGLGSQLINALIKLSVSSLSNLKPHPAYVFFHYSHPTLLQRKKAIENDQN